MGLLLAEKTRKNVNYGFVGAAGAGSGAVAGGVSAEFAGADSLGAAVGAGAACAAFFAIPRILFLPAASSSGDKSVLGGWFKKKKTAAAIAKTNATVNLNPVDI